MSKGQIASGVPTENPFIDVHEGRVAEWLGRGLQNLLRWFESTRDLGGLCGCLTFTNLAWVAELVDALVSNTNGSNTVPVRFRPQVHTLSLQVPW